jgi:hypothetical protein
VGSLWICKPCGRLLSGSLDFGLCGRIPGWGSRSSRFETGIGGILLDPEPSHDIAYQRTCAACASFENLPGFFSSDSQEFEGLNIANKVPEWMHTAKEISIGGRRQVLEDGHDVCDSESDSENEGHGDELTGMYTSEIPVDEKGRPVSSAYKLSTDQANALRMGARCSEEFKGSTIQASAAGFCEATKQPSPVCIY